MTYLFIINPFAGKSTLSDNLRENIQSIEALKNKEVLIFNSEYPGHETVLVNQVMRFLPEEDFFICICAGSGSFHHVLNANLDFNKIKTAIFPCGETNDSLRFFGNKALTHFEDITKIISGSTLYLDYIKTSSGNAFDTISWGYSAKIINFHQKLSFLSIFNPSLLWFIAFFFGIITDKAQRYEISIDNKKYDGHYHEIICANGNTQGGALFLGDDVTPDDGLINFILIPKMNIFSLIKTVLGFYLRNPKLLSKKVLRVTGKTFSVRGKDGKQLQIELDGELKTMPEICGKIITNKLPFVVPKDIAEKYINKKRKADEKK